MDSSSGSYLFRGLVSAALLTVFGTAAAVVAGCDGISCTEADCISGLTVEFDEPLPLDYSVTLTRGDVSETFHCTPESTFIESTTQLGGSVDCRTTQFYYAFPGYGEVDEIQVTLTVNGTSVSQNYEPDYTEFSPNGDACPPTCYGAAVVLDVPSIVAADD